MLVQKYWAVRLANSYVEDTRNDCALIHWTSACMLAVHPLKSMYHFNCSRLASGRCSQLAQSLTIMHPGQWASSNVEPWLLLVSPEDSTTQTVCITCWCCVFLSFVIFLSWFDVFSDHWWVEVLPLTCLPPHQEIEISHVPWQSSSYTHHAESDIFRATSTVQGKSSWQAHHKLNVFVHRSSDKVRGPVCEAQCSSIREKHLQKQKLTRS